MCSIEDCSKAQFCRGYCRSHYYRFKRYGDATEGISYKEPRPECSEYGCARTARIRGRLAGFCNDHGLWCLVCGTTLGNHSVCVRCSDIMKACGGEAAPLYIVARFLEVSNRG